MQLNAPRAPGPVPDDIAVALRAAASRLGHRPAVSLLLPEGRQEQAAVSLAQWAAKGAHLLELDHLLEPGDEVRLDAPWSWTSAAVALAVWWTGGVVRLGPGGDAEVAVLGADRDPDPAVETYRLGDGIDGAPAPGAAPSELPAWTRAAQPLPDQPPPPRAVGQGAAVRAGARSLAQGEALERAVAVLGTDGPVGLAIDAVEADEQATVVDRGGTVVDPVDALLLVALRPLLTDAPTVVVRGTSIAAASGDRVRRWAIVRA